MAGASSYTPDWHSPWYLMKGNHGASSSSSDRALSSLSPPADLQSLLPTEDGPCRNGDEGGASTSPCRWYGEMVSRVVQASAGARYACPVDRAGGGCVRNDTAGRFTSVSLDSHPFQGHNAGRQLSRNRVGRRRSALRTAASARSRAERRSASTVASASRPRAPGARTERWPGVMSATARLGSRGSAAKLSRGRLRRTWLGWRGLPSWPSEGLGLRW